VPLLPFEKMMNMPQDQSVVFFAGKHDPLFVSRTPYCKIPRLSGVYDPEPFHPSA
jgi:type IV secretory pathway TraG/TraD family ATPase VirD4